MVIVTENDHRLVDRETLDGFTKILYHFQLASISAMEKIEQPEITMSIGGNEVILYENNFGIFANQVGSGKTLVLLGLCKRNKRKGYPMPTTKTTSITPVFPGPFMKVTSSIPESIIRINTTLIIVPHLLMPQWVKELDDTSLTYTNLSKITVIKFKDYIKDMIFNKDVILLPATKYKYFIKFFPHYHPNIQFIRCIVDEIDTIQIQGDKIGDITSFVWGVTATPMNLYINNGSRSLSSFIATRHLNYNTSRYIANITVDCCKDWIAKTYSNNIFKRFYKCLEPAIVKFSHFLNTDTTELINAGDISSVMEILGGKIETYSDIESTLSKTINKKISKVNAQMRELCTNPEYNTSYTITRMEDLKKRHASLITKLERIKETIEETKQQKSSCGICLSEPCTHPALLKCCNNIMCLQCITTWIKTRSSGSKCPLCRTKIDFNTISALTESVGSSSSSQSLKPKVDMVIDIINNNPDGKFIVVSKHYSSFRILDDVFHEHGIPYVELKGHSSTVQSNIAKFNNGEIKVVFLNYNYAGSGLNLPCTTDIILYHELSVESEIQALGRALRLDRPANMPLNVHCLQYSTEYANQK